MTENQANTAAMTRSQARKWASDMEAIKVFMALKYGAKPVPESEWRSDAKPGFEKLGEFTLPA